MDTGKRPFHAGHRVDLLCGGKTYFDRLVDLIGTARYRIHLQVYIFESDQTGELVLNALEKAASRGIEVFLLVDGFGSFGFRRAIGNRLTQAGIRFRYFARLPLETLRQPARRLHVKVCVADGQRAIIGGINISDKYRGSDQVPPWLDSAVFAEGPVCASIEQECAKRFGKPAISGAPVFESIAADTQPGVHVRLSTNDLPRGKREISASYKRMFRSAQRELIIVNSYFLPSYRLLRSIRKAAKRGCAVTVLVGSVSDVPLVRAATRHLYSRLLKSGVRVAEYRTGILHAKVCIVDGRWLNLGSYNLNHLSEFFSVESNLEVLDSAFASECRSALMNVIRDESVWVEAVTTEGIRGLLLRILDALAYRLLRSTRHLFLLFGRKPPQAVF
ncbi:MAG: phospholipase D-like domain-containing protein [Bacteroidota bacterium]